MRKFVTCAEFLIQEISQRLDSRDLFDIRMGENPKFGIQFVQWLGHWNQIFFVACEQTQ